MIRGEWEKSRKSPPEYSNYAECYGKLVDFCTKFATISRLAKKKEWRGFVMTTYRHHGSTSPIASLSSSAVVPMTKGASHRYMLIASSVKTESKLTKQGL